MEDTMTIKGIIPITLSLIVTILLTPAIFAQSTCPYTVTAMPSLAL